MPLKSYKKPLLTLTAFMLIVFVSGCASFSGSWSVKPQDDTAIPNYLGKGSSAIQGQAYARLWGGTIVYAAGSTVLLVPYTQYIRKYKDRLVDVTKDPFLSQYIQKTQADAGGRFRFSGLRDGKYLVFADIAWNQPYYANGFTSLERHHLTVYSIVETAVGQTVTVAVSEH